MGLAGAAATSAAASALPGDPLYAVKQVTEAVELRVAPTDSAREAVLLNQADTRVDEAARLLEGDHAAEAAVTAARYADALAELTATSESDTVQLKLRTNEVRLSALLQSA